MLENWLEREKETDRWSMEVTGDSDRGCSERKPTFTTVQRGCEIFKYQGGRITAFAELHWVHYLTEARILHVISCVVKNKKNIKWLVSTLAQSISKLFCVGEMD